MKKRVFVRITPEGTKTFTVEGIAGSGCLNALPLEVLGLMGEVESFEPTPEMELEGGQQSENIETLYS